MNAVIPTPVSSIKNPLDRLFRPRSIAIIGASSTPTKIGGLPVAFLLQHGFRGEVFPINPGAKEIQGLKAYASVREVAGEVDLAIIAVPAAMVETAIDEAIAAKVHGIVLFSSGFAEVGEEGAHHQQRLMAKAEAAGVRVLGPNCLGFMNLSERVFATFSPVVAVGATKSGRIGLVSQSGAYGAYAFTLARERGLGLSYWITTGNEGNVDFADCVAWLAEDPDTDVILGYMEGCRDGRKLEAALAAAAAAGKPVVITKVGRTEVGAQAAASHTAALAGEDAVFDAVFRHHGVYRAHSIEEFFDVGYAVSVAGLPRGTSTGLFTVSGGAGVLMADAATDAGLDLPEMPATAQEKIREMVPFAAPRNPVDITGQITNDLSLLEQTVRLMLEQGDYDMMVSFLAAAGLGRMGPVVAENVIRCRKEFPERIFAVVSVFRDEVRQTLEAEGCLVFEDPSRAIRALAALAHFAKRRSAKNRVTAVDALALPLTKKIEPRIYTEPEGLELLRRVGVTVPNFELVKSAAEAASAASKLGGPVVAKIVSPDVLHKSDVGGVKLGITGPEAATAAYEEIISAVTSATPGARIEGVLIASMEKGGVECIVGVQHDPAFGPVVMFGLGGIFVEVLRDVSFRTAPINHETASEMISEVRGYALLKGARGQAPADIDALADLLVRVSHLAAGCGDSLESLDINPVLVRPVGEGVVALDALVVGKR